jgi:signal transduction histidine kinase
MHHNRLFQKTRQQLASWYAGVMALILGIGGLAVYEVVSYTRWQIIDQELESVAGTLHDGLEPFLHQHGQLDVQAQKLLPSLCLPQQDCMTQREPMGRHILGALHSEGYYMRFMNMSGQVVATIGMQPKIADSHSANLVANPSEIAQLTCQDCSGKRIWQTFDSFDKTRYRQISLLLEPKGVGQWGYIQVGRSLKEFDQSITLLRLILFLGLPIFVCLIAVAAWWMAGLAMRPVHQSYEQIQQFTADAAHELRTPLAAIRATVEATLGNQELTLEQSRTTLQTIERQNHRLSQLVQDLLFLARLDLRVLTVQLQPCCLNDVVSDLIEEFAALAIAAEIKLIPDVEAKPPLLVLGNEEQLYRLLANLLTNAIHFTPADGRVTVGLQQSESFAVLQVQDNGIGMTAEDQSRIFDRFYRVNPDRSRQTGGAGLGLAIVQAIVQSHGGTIQVQSEVGKGSTFTVRLPLSLE